MHPPRYLLIIIIVIGDTMRYTAQNKHAVMRYERHYYKQERFFLSLSALTITVYLNVHCLRFLIKLNGVFPFIIMIKFDYIEKVERQTHPHPRTYTTEERK